jgi:hypothetical protein
MISRDKKLIVFHAINKGVMMIRIKPSIKLLAEIVMITVVIIWIPQSGFVRDSTLKQLRFASTYSGSINSKPLRARGEGILAFQTSYGNDVRYEYTELPDGFHPFALSCTVVIACFIACQAEGRAMNLWQLTGGNYGFKRIMTWSGMPNSRIAINAVARTVGDNLNLDATFSGKYDGPTDLVSVSDIKVLWRNDKNGIQETGSATIHRRNGKTFKLSFTTIYLGILKPMEVPQEGIVSYRKLTFNNRILHASWDGRLIEAK